MSICPSQLKGWTEDLEDDDANVVFYTRCGYAGSNKVISVERDSFWKEELLEPLPLLE